MYYETQTDSRELHDEIKETAKAIFAGMSDEIKQDIDRANTDLYYGPTYYNAENERCEWCDAGRIPFDFVSACKRIANALGDISDIRVEIGYDDETQESFYDSVEDSAREIKLQIVGKELLGYVL